MFSSFVWRSELNILLQHFDQALSDINRAIAIKSVVEINPGWFLIRGKILQERHE